MLENIAKVRKKAVPPDFPMLQNRFTETWPAPEVTTQPFINSAVGGFVALPILAAASPMQQLVYLQAFADAQQQIQAERRAKWLAMSLN